MIKWCFLGKWPKKESFFRKICEKFVLINCLNKFCLPDPPLDCEIAVVVVQEQIVQLAAAYADCTWADQCRASTKYYLNMMNLDISRISGF